LVAVCTDNGDTAVSVWLLYVQTMVIQQYVWLLYLQIMLIQQYLVAVFTDNADTAVSVWLLYVQSFTPDDGRRDRPKHVELLQNKINLRHWCTCMVLL